MQNATNSSSIRIWARMTIAKGSSAMRNFVSSSCFSSMPRRAAVVIAVGMKPTYFAVAGTGSLNGRKGIPGEV